MSLSDIIKISEQLKSGNNSDLQLTKHGLFTGNAPRELWRVDISKLKGLSDPDVTDLAISPDSKLIASCHKQQSSYSEFKHMGLVILWDISSGRHIRSIACGTDDISFRDVNTACFTSDGKWLLCAIGSDDLDSLSGEGGGNIVRLDYTHGKRDFSFLCATEYSRLPEAPYSLEDKWFKFKIISIDSGNTIIFPEGNKGIAVLSKQENGNFSRDVVEINFGEAFGYVSLAGDKTHVVYAHSNGFGILELKNAVRGSPKIQNTPINKKHVDGDCGDMTYSVITSSDGRNVITCSKTELKVWDYSTGTPLRILHKRTGTSSATEFGLSALPNTQYIISSGILGTREIGMFDILSGNQIWSVSLNSEVISMAVSSDCRYLLCATKSSLFSYDISEHLGKKTRYRVVFRGNIRDGYDKEKVKKRFFELFKLGDQDLMCKLFSGERIIIKSNIDHNLASRYLEAICSIGANCDIEEMT
jgi:WD40 repeat protein